MGRCYKYEGEQSEWHSGTLTWPGLEYPFLESEDVPRSEEREYVPTVFFYSKLFNLNDTQDKEHYVWVNDRIVNGWFVQYHKQIKPLESDKDTSVYVYLEWGQVYLVCIKKREGNENAKSPRSIPWV